MVSPPASRRQLLGLAGGALSGVALAACGGPHHPAVKPAGPVTAQDLVLLRGLLALERRTVAAYEAGIPLLDQDTAKDAQQFLGQELSHAGELTGLLKRAKVKPPPPPGSFHLGHPRTEADVLALLHRLEAAQLAAYLSAITEFSNGSLRAAAAAILANDAQHITVLRRRLSLTPAPEAFVTGRE